MDTRAQGLKEWELHGRKGKVARREGGVAAPELPRVAPKLGEGETGGVGVEHLCGRGGGGWFADHLCILLQDFCGGENETGY